MYVCALDKPWKDSSFIFQGFLVQNDNIIQQVKDECQTVYIDVSRQSMSVSISSAAGKLADTRRTKVNTAKKRRATDTKSGFFKSIPLLINTKFSKSPKRLRHNNLQDIVNKHINVKDIQPPKKIKSFEREINEAQSAHKNTRLVIQKFMDEVEAGGTIDMQIANKAVQDCMFSVLRSPDAMMLMTRLKTKDKKTWQHSMNTCVMAITLGRFLNLEEEELKTLGLCAMLHDIGKTLIPEGILNKSSGLNADELKIMQSHTTLGRNMLTTCSFKGGMITEILNKSTELDFEQMKGMELHSPLGNNILTSCSKKLESIIADVAYCHHERLDGHGYPQGLSDIQISPYAKMIAIVDAYDSLTNDKNFRMGKTHFEAIEILLKRTDSHFDRTLVGCFIQALGTYPAGSAVELRSGEIGLVIEVNQQQKLKPKIIILSDQQKKPHAEEKIIDLARLGRDKSRESYTIKTIIRPDAYNIDINRYYNYGVIQQYLEVAA